MTSTKDYAIYRRDRRIYNLTVKYLSLIHIFIAHLENINLKIEKVDKINYGVQLTAISNNKKEYKIRVYQNSKGKITLDASLIKDDEIRLSVLEYLSLIHI